jgi:hypothetical protein
VVVVGAAPAPDFLVNPRMLPALPLHHLRPLLSPTHHPPLVVVVVGGDSRTKITDIIINPQKGEDMSLDRHSFGDGADHEVACTSPQTSP